MLETEIGINNIIFFMSVIEITTIIGSIITGILAYLLFWQIRKQKKVSSAQFMVNYVDNILEKNKDTVDIIHERKAGTGRKFKSDKSIRILLSGFDNTVQFVNDGIIDKNQVLNMLRITLTIIKHDTEIQRIIKETQQKHKTAFDKIIKFMNEELS